jgi:hypothetical protein
MKRASFNAAFKEKERRGLSLFRFSFASCAFPSERDLLALAKFRFSFWGFSLSGLILGLFVGGFVG